MTVAASERHPVEQLAEDFVTRYRRGERPSLSEYVRQYPAVSGELADIIQALLLLEDLGANGDAADESPPVPERLGEYRILREIGRGGMGVVYEAEQGELGRRVALKVLPAAALLRPTHLERFRREARAAARLHHTNIIPVHGVGAQDGVHYYAMQYIPGRGLDDVLAEVRQQGARPAGDTAQAAVTPLTGSGRPGSADYCRAAARVVLQIADALAHAHTHGVLHRDVKPANVVLDESGTAWLGDFGLAHLEGDQPLTSAGGFVGTLRYLAPERFKGEGDARSDVYSLGATLYELLTLRPMFDQTDRPRLIRQVTLDEPPAPRAVAPAIPKDLETIVLKATAKAPADRYGSAAAFADDLRRFLAGRPVSARRLSRGELTRRWVRRNPVVAGLLTAVLLALAAGLGATWSQWRRAEGHLADKTEALAKAERSAAEAVEQSARAAAHGRRAHDMTHQLLEELGQATPVRQSATEIRRRLMEKALAVFQQHADATVTEPHERFDVARLAVEVGAINLTLLRFVAAEEYFNRALTLIAPEADGGDPAVRLLKGRAHGHLASALREQSHHDDAQRQGRLGIAALEKLVADQPADGRIRRELASVWNTLAVSYGDQGKNAESVAALQSAVATLTPILATDPVAQHSMAFLNRNLAVGLRYARRWDEARAAAVASVGFAEPLAASKPPSLPHLELLGDALHTLGNCLMRQVDEGEAGDAEAARDQCAEAEAAFRRAVAARQRLVDASPSDAAFRAKLSGSRANLGIVVSQLGRSAEAESQLEKSLQDIKAALRTSPRNRTYLRTAVNHYRALGNNRCRAGDHVRAATLVETILKVQTGEGFEGVGAAQLLAHCSLTVARDEKLTHDERSAAAGRYADRAMDSLRLAVKRGYQDRGTLQSSAGLRPLRSRDDFQKLLAEMPTDAKPAATPPDG
jgi:serine/threonine protein kinase